MKPCISQATTMSTPLEADLPAFARGGWRAVELWLTKLETYLEGHTIDELRELLDSHGLVPAAAAGQGGLLLSRGDERETHWSHFRRRLAILQELRSPDLDRRGRLRARALGRRLRPRRRRARRGGRAGRRSFGVRDRTRVPEVVGLLRQPGHRARPGRPVRLEPRRRLPRPVPLLHRARASSRTWPTCPATTWPGSRSAT